MCTMVDNCTYTVLWSFIRTVSRVSHAMQVPSLGYRGDRYMQDVLVPKPTGTCTYQGSYTGTY